MTGKITTRLLRGMLAIPVCLLGAAFATAESIPIDDVQRQDAISFEKEILPILQKNCLACHSAGEKAGELVLESPQGMIKGGDSGPSVVPGQGGESLILQLASHQDDPVMPPEGNDVAAGNLSPQELGLLKLWIDQGAKGSGEIDSLSPKQWQPLPAGVNPVQAIALTEDGQFVACSRANQIFLYHVPTGQLITKLSDPSLDTEQTTGIAHRDLVQSLAFNVDGDLLASGGFRQVKLWRRPRDAQRLNLDVGSAATAVAVDPKQQWLAVALADHTISLLKVADGTKAISLVGHTDEIKSLRFTSDGTQLVSGSLDQTVRVWNVTDGSPAGLIETPAAVNAIELVDRDVPSEANATVMPFLVTGDVEKLIRVWHLPESMPRRLESSINDLAKTAVSSDGQLLAMLDKNNAIRIVSLVEADDQPLGREVTTWTVDRGVTALAFVAESHAEGTKHHLLTGANDGSIRMWSLPERQLLGQWSADEKPITSLAVSSDGKIAASGIESGAITLWNLDVSAATHPEIVDNIDSPIELTSLSGSRKQLAFVRIKEGQPTICVFDFDAGKIVAEFSGHDSSIGAIAFSLDESHLASSDGKSIRVWNLKDPGQGEVHQIEVPAEVTAIAANQDGSQVLAGFADNTLRLYNAIDGTVATQFDGHGGAILGCGFYSNQPYSVAADQSVRFWNGSDGSQTRTFNLPSKVSALAMSPDGSRMVFGCEDKQVRVIQTDNGNILQTLPPLSHPAVGLGFRSDTRQIAVLTTDARLSIWNVDDGRLCESFLETNAASMWFAAELSEVWTGDREGRIVKRPLRFLRHLDGNSQAITDMLFHSNGQTLFTAAADGSLRGYNTQNGQQLFATSHGAAIHDLAISPNEQVLATTGDNATVRLWQTNGGGFGPQQITGLGGPARSVAFSNDSTRLVLGYDGEAPAAQVHEVQSGLLLQRYSESAGPVVGLFTIPSDETGSAAPFDLLTASSSGVFRRQCDAVRTISGHSQSITSLAADPEPAKLVYSGSLDGSIRLWNLENGQQVRQFNHGGPVNAIAVSPDGQRLASTSENARVKLFQTNNGQQIAEMRGDVRLKTQFTRTQQRLNSANARLNVAKRLFDDAEKDVPKKAEAEKKLSESLAAANKTVGEKQEAVDKAMEEKLAAEKAAIEASAAAKNALADQQQAELLAQNAAAEMQTAQARMNQLQAALASNPENDRLKDLVEAAQKELTDCQQRSQQFAAEVRVPTEKAQQMAAAANTAAQQVNNVQKPYSDASAELKTALSDQNLLSQQQALAAKELTEAEELVPQRQEALARAEEAKAQAEEAVATANAAVQASEKPIRSVCFSPDGSILATAGDFFNLHTWDGQTGEAIAAFAGHSEPTQQLAFVDGNTMVSISSDQSCRLWELNPSWVLEKTIGNKDDADIIVHRATAVDFNPDSTQLLVASGVPSRSGELHLFNIDDGSRVVYLPRAHDDVVYSARISPDGKRIASGGADKYLRTFDIVSSTELRRFEGHTDYVLGVCWKSDGESIASSSADQTIKLWESETGDQRRTINQQLTKHVTSVQFIGDTNTVISSSGDKRVRIHNGDNGGVARNFSDVSSWLHGVAITPDSKIVAAGDASGTVTIWDGTNGRLLQTLAVDESL